MVNRVATIMSKQQCRICLKQGSTISIFHERDSLKISTKIMSLANVPIYPEDGLPSSICRKCVKRLDICIEFVQLCRNSDSKLRTLSENKELLETDIDLMQNAYNEDLSKFSPKSDSAKDFKIDESTSQSFCYSNEFIKKEVELTDLKDNYDQIKIKNEKKTEKQQCFTCGRVMSSRFRLKTHLRTHTGERPFSCPHCTKTFSLSQNLKVHLRIHTGEKPLACTECGEKFAHSAGLAAHRRKHTGQTPYRCVLCPRSFRTVGHLQYHIRRHTGEKNFECDICSRAFITRSDLKQHLLSHSGVKPHVCSICGLRLTRASHLRRHVQFIHSGEHFECSLCPSKFKRKEELEKHVTGHEKNDKILQVLNTI